MKEDWKTVPPAPVPKGQSEYAYGRKYTDVAERAVPTELYAALVSAALEGGKALKAQGWCGRLALSRQPGSHPELLLALAKDPDHDVREGVAHNPSAPAEALDLLSGDRRKSTREGVARNWNTKAETLLRMLAKAKGLRTTLAGNPNMPAEKLAELARDRDPSVRAGVAGNPSITQALFEALAVDGDERVRAKAAMNGGVPSRLLARFVSDPGHYPRECGARNPDSPSEALEAYARDQDPEVRDAATIGLAPGSK